MPSRFTPFQGDAGCTSLRQTISVVPAAFGLLNRNKWGDAYEFTDGTNIFTVYTPQGFSEDPEVHTNWDSVQPTWLNVGASFGTPKADVDAFVAWIQAISNSYKAASE